MRTARSTSVSSTSARWSGWGPLESSGSPSSAGASARWRHSDADVLAHAAIDALLGAAGLGDIGQHYPDTDERWRDADSIELLREVCGFLAEHGWSVRHLDATVICETPKLGPLRDKMRARLAEAVGIPTLEVNVKFTTNEGMGFLGRGEGMAALVVATTERA